jgi:hypothetical protein
MCGPFVGLPETILRPTMRLSDAEKGPYHKMREVSSLRTQFQCEYRLHLKQKLRQTHTLASVTGTELHRRVSIQSEFQHVEKTENRLLPLLIIILTLIVGFLWIFW